MAVLSYSQSKKLSEIAKKFSLEKGKLDIIESFGGGRINRTYKITIRRDDERFEYLLQNINNFVFPDTKGLMDNVTAVTEYVRANGGRALNYIKCLEDVPSEHKNGEYIFIDDKGMHWRMYHFIDADVYPCIVNSYHAYMLGKAIAEFSSSLDGFEATKLVETIPDFHNTPKRFQTFLRSIASDVVCGRKRSEKVLHLIRFVLEREDELGALMEPLENGEIPYRVVHNDPKLNNVLFDKENNSPICMIDLDTIMPGTSLFDVGDALRSIANTASEDERTTENVSFSTEIFEEFVRGYISGMEGTLNTKEIELIPKSVWVIAMELGIRFLTDHIDGNIYFKTEYDGQNVERANIQFRLASCVEEKIKSGELDGIIKGIVR